MLSQINNYLLAVRVVKLVVLMVAGAFVVALVMPTLIRSVPFSGHDKQGKKRVSISEIRHNAAEGLRLYGSDDKSQPFTIQAQHLEHTSDKHVKLRNVMAQHILLDQTVFSAISDVAEVEPDLSKVYMTGNVVMMQDDAYSLSAQNIYINYKDSTASGEKNVELAAEFGKVAAEAFEADNNYGTIKFLGGRVRTTLYGRGKGHGTSIQ